ncbi:right-handed parallel beta-helix repeat-containing protein [Phenylobacterium immobile]|uniref:right-handed parallel beta-helix repeat-containing protein n=1 Tax=Phenylobacterium immobile TaxID=21 RepID=UPI000AB4EFA8|nr:right-handed parallel beta-helix repeat-containing protein [Phenylobacterium immobile]
MALSRRTLLARLAVLGGLGPAGLAAAQGAKPINLADYGGGRGDPVVDTQAVRRCIADAAKAGVPWIVPKGTWALSPDPADAGKPFSFHGPEFPIIPCITLAGPTHCIGMGGRFVMSLRKDYPKPIPKGARMVMFATRQTLTPLGQGVRNIVFENAIFDFDQRFSSTAQSPYGFELNGVDGVSFLKCAFKNSALEGTTGRRGWGLSLLNCRNLKINGNRFTDIAQGMNARYVTDIELNDNVGRNMAELFDFDGVVSRMVSRRNTFIVRPDTSAEMYDLSSARDVIISDVRCEGAAAVISIYDKPTTPPTYAGYHVGRKPPIPPDYTTSDNILVERLTAKDCYGGMAIRVGIGRHRTGTPGYDTTGRPSPKRVVFRDVTLTNSGPIRIDEGQVAFQNLTMTGGPKPKFSRAMFIAEKNRTTAQIDQDATLELTLDNVRITGAPTEAILIRRARLLRLRNVSADTAPGETVQGWREHPSGLVYALPTPAGAAKK